MVTVIRSSRLSPRGDSKTPERVGSPQSVAPGDLLAFGERAAVIGDRHLVDAQVGDREDAGGALRLEAKVLGDERQAAGDVPADGLVAHLHVRQGGVEQHAGDEAEQPVAGVVPKEMGALRLATWTAAA